MIPKNLIKNSS